MKPFKILVLYHSHIDIGYTERQEKIATYQADFTRQAVDAVLKNEKFKYTAEGFWAVEQYLHKYGKKGELRLVEAIKTNRFELACNYLHFTELIDQEMMEKSLQYSLDFCTRNNIKSSQVFMSTDVNGFSWGFSEAMFKRGVRFLYTSINSHHGGVPFDKPLTPFYWITPEGNKVLVWNGLTYHKGNLLGLVPGWTLKGDPMVPGLKPVESGFVKVAEPNDFANERIHSLVKSYQENGYPFNFLPICASGLYTDNSPLSDEHVSLIDKWNKLYGEEIKIELVTLTELYQYVSKNKDIPEVSGDWNDYWTDGVLSTPDETRLYLNARRNKDTIKLIDPNFKHIKKEEYESLLNKLLLYAEHTWGHSASWSDPYRLLVKQLDLRKAKLAIDADQLSSEMLDNLSLKFGEGEFRVGRPFEYMIINPHNISMSQEILLPTDYWEEPIFMNQNYVIRNKAGKIYPTQKKVTLRGSFFSAVMDFLPKEEKLLYLFSHNEQAVKKNNEGFNGKFYQVSYDSKGIHSIKANGIEQLDKPGFVVPIYQLFKDGKRNEAAGFGYANRNVPSNEIFLPEVKGMDVLADGNVFKTIRYTYSLKGTTHVYTDITFFYESKQIHVSVQMGKEFEIDPEGLYVNFPFSTKNRKWLLDKPDTLIEPGMQIPGTCFDYYAVQNGVILEGEHSSVSINTLDSPLVTFERIKLWEYNKSVRNKGDLFVWLLNNKWETNFRTETAGYLESRFIVSFNDSLKEAVKSLKTDCIGPLVLRK